MTPELPKGVTLDDRGHEIDIAWRWFTPSSWLLIGFAAIWNGFVLIFLLSGAFPFFLVLHVLAGLVVGWEALKQALNRTTVNVSSGKIAVSSGPVGASNHAVIDPLNLQQLYSIRRKTGSTNGRPTYSYEIHAIVSNQRDDVLVVGNIGDLDQALFIEGEIERYLEITDQEVPGAMSRQTGKPVSSSAPPLAFEVKPEKPRLQDGRVDYSDAEIRDAVSNSPREWQGAVIEPDQNPIIEPDRGQ